MAELPDVVNDPSLRALNAIQAVEHPDGRFETVGVPFHIEGADVSVRGRSPEAGEHTSQVLEEAGIGEGRIAELAQAGVFG
jgi:crotonobetainyl-CoA:carnitine CoA-transferase CaiB-like acyl-CoA transferase